MENTRKQFNSRAFVAIMLTLLALGLPISGLLLHVNEHSAAGHDIGAVHVLLGIIFIVFGCWHVILNRRLLVKHFLLYKAKSWRLNSEFRWAILIFGIILLISIIHGYH